MEKQIGIIGLGKMGGNVARRLARLEWKVVGFNRTEEVTRNLEKDGITGAYSLEDLVNKLESPRLIINLLPTGVPTDENLEKLLPLLDSSDIIIEMANSYYKETIKRAEKVTAAGKRFIDVGISGGPMGALNGACLMVGGDVALFKELELLFKDMAAPGAVAHFPGIGAGHFVKMVHNGIEYGMMQSIAEGFGILKKSSFEFDLNKVAQIYNNGSVIESRLIKWLEQGFQEFGVNLEQVSGVVPRGGEGEWTVETAKELNVEVKVIEDSVQARKESETENSYEDKILNTMRSQFGGHPVEKK